MKKIIATAILAALPFLAYAEEPSDSKSTNASANTKATTSDKATANTSAVTSIPKTNDPDIGLPREIINMNVLGMRLKKEFSEEHWINQEFVNGTLDKRLANDYQLRSQLRIVENVLPRLDEFMRVQQKHTLAFELPYKYCKVRQVYDETLEQSVQERECFDAHLKVVMRQAYFREVIWQRKYNGREQGDSDLFMIRRLPSEDNPSTYSTNNYFLNFIPEGEVALYQNTLMKNERRKRGEVKKKPSEPYFESLHKPKTSTNARIHWDFLKFFKVRYNLNVEDYTRMVEK